MSKRTWRRYVGVCGLVLLAALPGGVASRVEAEPGPVPLGPEFLINTSTLDLQRTSAIDTDAQGNFVVTWASSGQDGSGAGIYAQRFNAEGTPVAGEFQVNTTTSGNQSYPDVSVGTEGDFVVVWSDYSTSPSSISGQVFSRDGDAQGGEFRIASPPEQRYYYPAVARRPDGSFLVVWDSYDSSYSYTPAKFELFGPDTTPLAGPFRVSDSMVPVECVQNAVAAAADGSFVVTWGGYNDTGGMDVFVRRFDAMAIPLSAVVPVDAIASSVGQSNPRLGMDAEGNFVVTWSSGGQDGDGTGIFARCFNAEATPLTDEFQINSTTAGNQRKPHVGRAPYGDFTVIWESNGQDGSGYGIFGQSFNAQATPGGVEFQVNTYTATNQEQPAVAMDPYGNFTAVWTSSEEGGDSFDIFGRQFQGLPTVAPTATPTAMPLWYDPAWAYRKVISIDYTKVGGSLSNFPVLIHLGTDEQLAERALDSGADLLVTAADGITKLSREIERFDGTSGELWMWVNVSSLSNTDDTLLYLYYGNPAGAETDSTDTWDSNYVGVWHLTDTHDSTAYANHGTKVSPGHPADTSAGQIGGAQQFVEGDLITVPDRPEIHQLENMSFEVWVNVEDFITYRCLISKQNTFDSYFMISPGGGIVHSGASVFYRNNSMMVEGPTAPPLNEWAYVVFTMDSRHGIWYLNATVNGQNTFWADAPASDEDLRIGLRNDGVCRMKGPMDELRLSNTARSPEWITTSYNNQRAPGDFAAAGPEESDNTPTPTVTPTATSTDTPTATPTSSPTATSTDTPTTTPTATPSATATKTPNSLSVPAQVWQQAP